MSAEDERSDEMWVGPAPVVAFVAFLAITPTTFPARLRNDTQLI